MRPAPGTPSAPEAPPFARGFFISAPGLRPGARGAMVRGDEARR